jgi:hypothetical protein
VNSDLIFWEHFLFEVMYFLKYEISYFIWSHILRISLPGVTVSSDLKFFFGELHRNISSFD